MSSGIGVFVNPGLASVAADVNGRRGGQVAGPQFTQMATRSGPTPVTAKVVEGTKDLDQPNPQG